MFQEVFIWQHNKKLILGLVDLIRYYSFADSTLRTLDGIVFPKRESNGCVVREFRDFTFWYKFDDSGSHSVVILKSNKIMVMLKSSKVMVVLNLLK